MRLAGALLIIATSHVPSTAGILAASPTPTPEETVRASMDGFGVDVNVSRATRGGAARSNPAAQRDSDQNAAVSQPRYEFRGVVGCAGNSPDGSTDSYCSTAMAACGRGETGPLMWIYRRDTTTPPGPWLYQGSTCQPDQIPAATPPGPTEADLRAAIEQAFATTPLARPTPKTQPPGGASLVDLPTYFQLTWPATPANGYAPGHSRALTLLGQAVELRITARYTFTFGDGTTTGLTTSPGGPYPSGDITHTYEKTGTVQPLATTTLSAEYRIAAGPWQPVTGATTRSTPLGPLDILASQPVLVPNAT